MRFINFCSNKIIQHLIIYTPLFLQLATSNIRATIYFIKSLALAEIADTLPTEISSIKKSGFILKTIEYLR